MILHIMTGGIVIDEADLVNEKFKEDPAKFSEKVKTIIQNSTISTRTWNRLNDDVKEELTRLGYKHK